MLRETLLKFVDRQREMQSLDDFYHTPTAGLFILYGRRRVGKTRLLSHWLESRRVVNALYWTATTHGTAYQLRDFSQQLLRFDPRFQSPPAADFSFPDWEAALEHLVGLSEMTTTPLLVILDEFTYLIRHEPALVSVLQKMWDLRLSRLPNLRLVLTGSMVGMMERDVLSYQAPLYGRATFMLKLRPLSFGVLAELFLDHTPAERVAIYAISGGVPAYLELFTRARQVSDALRDHCLTPGSIMLVDPHLILHDQLQDPHTYESVLWAIASGFHVWTEIAKMAGISESSLGHYVKALQALNLIERRDPVLAPAQGRRGRYYVRDPFMRFYYRFIVPHITSIERGMLTSVVRTINDDLRAFIGTYVFEELCREWVWVEADRGSLGFIPEEVGAYWGRSRGEGVQLDVMVASRLDKRLFIAEAKWGVGMVSRRILTDLVQRSQRMPQVREGWRVQYGLFAREGFTPAAQEEARRIGARLIDLEELEQTLVDAAGRAGLPLPDEEIEF
jgi:AAA+ ATPase superfamily predicted ATPase